MERISRNPMLLLKLSGSFLFRYAQCAFLSLLFHDPPRLFLTGPLKLF